MTKIGKGLLNQRTHNPLYIYKKKYRDAINKVEESKEEFAEEFDASLTKENNNNIDKGQKQNNNK